MEMNFDQARFNMVEQQIRTWEVLDQRILDIVGATPRHLFVPEAYRKLAYSDTRIPIGQGQIMLNPNLEARMLQELGVRPEERVLEVGTGSGFSTACLAQLAAEVESVEVFEDLAATARARLAAYANVTVKTGDAASGWGEPQSYDAILVTGSVPDVPSGLKQALRVGGRLCVVVGDTRAPIMDARIVVREAENSWFEVSVFETHIPALINAEKPPQFVF